MVVNRKQPTVPVPPAVSRSSSTQPVPTKKTTKSAPKPKPEHNGHHEIESRKPQPKPSKKEKHKAKKRSSLLDRFFLLSLSIFAFYTFYTCRPNPLFPFSPPNALAHDSNPLCRSLAVYRTNVLEPFILPPLRQSIAYTHSITEPYIVQTQAHLEPYAAPVVRTAQILKPYVVTTIATIQRVWSNTLLPFYTDIFKPYWDTAIVPRYKQYVHPHLVPLGHRVKRLYRYYIANPVRIQFLRLLGYIEAPYEAHIRPYVVQIQPYVEKTFSLLRATSVRAWKLYVTHVHPRVVAAWAQVRPVLFKSWRHIRKTTYKYAKRATREAGALRRTYVDPHVKKIWDKVATPTSSTESSAITYDAETVLPSTLSDEHVSSVIEPTQTEAEESKVSILVPISAFAEEAHEPASATPSPSEAAEGAAPTVSILHSIGAYASDIPHVHAEPPNNDIEAPEVDVAVTLEEEVVVVVPGNDEPAVVVVEETVVVSNSSDEDDLEDFLRDIGVDSTTVTLDSEPTPSTSIAIQQQSSAAPNPQSSVDVAAKRADIVKRHEQWFVKVDQAVAEESNVLPQKLLAFREDKVKELQAINEAGAISNVQKEGEKLIKGAEAYLKKAEKRSSGWKVAKAAEVGEKAKETKKKIADGEKDKWSTVLDKVEEKFNDKVKALQQEVHLWFRNVKEGERQTITESTTRVKNLAEQGQASIGLDYAWLEDVTYHDWQRYHDLIRRFEAYEQKAYRIANGTSYVSPADPVVDLLNQLDAELQDVVLGFEVAVGRVRAEGVKVFSLAEGDDEHDGFFVVQDGQVRRDDLRGMDLGAAGIKKPEGAGVVNIGEKEEEVRILPIDPNPPSQGEGSAEGEFDASKVVIGKDKVQIEQALKDIPVEPPRHEEL
ncbi:hypothetical protein CPB84DRAFT_1845800 [Gymnopilus junonius]|uniref:Uncharacterized protein n=1 Tax=Gymnopilus junonius TaxID=109634 RepID=A0A9P5NR24_GYMJU|nr:hypothetical protein CPB84DRAFT_1845800 [Gymnopilus junonius]